MYDDLTAKLKYYGTAYAIGDNLGHEIQGTGELMLEAADVLEFLAAEYSGKGSQKIKDL